MSRLSIIAVVCLSAAQLLQAGSVQFHSEATRTSLLELYTSEGCSSCPPAETWLSRQKDASGLWKGFVPVVFHVDYWDYLGWRDPWASRRNSNRQRAYAAAWNSDNIYTPEFVLNGKEWRGWRGHKGVPKSADRPGVITVSSTNCTDWAVIFKPTTPHDGCEIHAALLTSGLNSDVKAGENQGRRLIHDFITLTLVNAPMARADGVFHGEFKLSPEPRNSPGQVAVAVWVTLQGNPVPIQATGGWLPSSE